MFDSVHRCLNDLVPDGWSLSIVDGRSGLSLWLTDGTLGAKMMAINFANVIRRDLADRHRYRELIADTRERLKLAVYAMAEFPERYAPVFAAPS